MPQTLSIYLCLSLSINVHLARAASLARCPYRRQVTPTPSLLSLTLVDWVGPEASKAQRSLNVGKPLTLREWLYVGSLGPRSAKTAGVRRDSLLAVPFLSAFRFPLLQRRHGSSCGKSPQAKTYTALKYLAPVAARQPGQPSYPPQRPRRVPHARPRTAARRPFFYQGPDAEG